MSTDRSWVEVDDEPHHVEKFRNDLVRVYEARIPAGTATQLHHHSIDTRYVTVSGGRFRSDEPGRQHPHTRLGRSITRSRQLILLARRLLTGWLQMPCGTLIIQPHAMHPLIHQVRAHPRNAGPVRMIGVELRDRAVRSSTIRSLSGLAVEHADQRATTYRIDLAPGTTTGPIPLDRGGVLIVAEGQATVGATDTRTVGGPAAEWLDAGTVRIASAPHQSLTAVLVVPEGGGRPDAYGVRPIQRPPSTRCATSAANRAWGAPFRTREPGAELNEASPRCPGGVPPCA
ncbi:MAG: hypothetical protein L0G99_02335 [Propionibacteriales bacterium]|nr:hypothetical protein [Propionibacteriales bacterium]